MCRLLGITNFDFQRHREILDHFAALGKRGQLLPGDPPGHTDGWGIAWYKDGKAFVRKSGGSILDEKGIYLATLEEAAQSPVMLAHLRKSAWKDTTSTRHAHPFQYGNYVFAHNGTVRDYPRLLSSITVHDRPLETALDTEVFFLYIMSFLPDGPRDAFSKAVTAITKNNEYSSLTSLLSDGNKLYACREFSKYPDYYTLFHARAGQSAIIASEPVASQLDWQLMKKGELLEI